MTFDLSDAVWEAMYAHAEGQQPRESCGLVVQTHGRGQVYWHCRNLASEGDQFVLSPVDFAEAEEHCAEILAVVHSHPNASANPSMADRVGCERSKLPWLIVGWPSGMLKRLEPTGWIAPYVGREFHHGVLDCYTLIQDWFVRELEIVLPDFEREDGWWEERPGHAAQDLYMNGFTSAGFVQVRGEPQRHDVILMNVRSDKANHGAVYLGNGEMLHHLHSRLSEITLYGGYWQRHTVMLLRHISQITPAQAFATALGAAELAAA